jgi:hypothetical protein
MINSASALRRGLLVMSLAAVMLAVVIGVTLATNVQGQERNSSASPMAGDTWVPEPTKPITYYASSNLRMVVTLTKVSAFTFDASSARFNVIESDGHTTQYSAVAKVMPNPNTVVITASGFNVVASGTQIQFQIFYTDAPGSYSSATYPLLALSHHLYIPIVRYTPDGSSPCAAISASPLTNYSIAQDQQYRFFSITLPVTSTVNVTATNYKVTGGQMQVRLRPASCETTGSQYVINYTTLLITKTNNTFATFNMAPGNYLVRFSADTLSTAPFTFRWSSLSGIGPYEPNNTLCKAYPVSAGNTYAAYADDAEDFYTFDTSSLSDATIKVTVSNFSSPGQGQYQLIKGTPDCTNYQSSPIAVADASLGTVTMSAAHQSAGRYFLRLIKLGQTGYTQSQAYAFRIDLSTSSAQSSASPSVGVPTPTPIQLPSEDAGSETAPDYSLGSEAPAP